MIYHHLFDQIKEKRIVRAGLIGSGHYGTAVITQSQYIPLLEIPIVADVDPGAARLAYHHAGITDDDIVLCDNRGNVVRAMESGKFVIVEDSMLLMDTPIDVIVESTGVPEAGARHAHQAIQHEKHVAMINKETDAVIGPILKHLADREGPPDRPTPQIDLPGPDVPSFPLESKPGDIFFLNMNLWHASFGGKPGRRHIALNFTPEPTLPEHIALLKKDYQGLLNLMEQTQHKPPGRVFTDAFLQSEDQCIQRLVSTWIELGLK